MPDYAGYPCELVPARAAIAAAGVTRCWSLPYAHKPGMARDLNRWMAETFADDAMVVAGATVHPGDDVADEIAEALDVLGLRVVKLHCSVGDFTPDDPRLDPLWRRVSATGRPVVVHAGHAENGQTTPAELAPLERVARRWPDAAHRPRALRRAGHAARRSICCGARHRCTPTSPRSVRCLPRCRARRSPDSRTACSSAAMRPTPVSPSSRPWRTCDPSGSTATPNRRCSAATPSGCSWPRRCACQACRGGAPAWSTRSIRARSPTRTATASAISRASAARLDHLAWLGVDAIWLSPIFRSPMADFGYDVADYCDVDPAVRLARRLRSPARRGARARPARAPRLGAEPHLGPASLVRRVARGRARARSATGTCGATRRPAARPPNNWMAAFPAGTRAWTLDPATGQYYLHCFLPEQPDLNWRNPEVVAAMHDVAALLARPRRRRLPRRRRAVPRQGPGAARRSRPASPALPHAVAERPSRHARARCARCAGWSTPTPAIACWSARSSSSSSPTSRAYYGRGDELHLAFDLPRTLHTPWEPRPTGESARGPSRRRTPRPARGRRWCSRTTTRLAIARGSARRRARARAAVLLLTLPGTPFLYAGEELGLEDASVPPDRRVDPGGRDGCRAPIPWDASPRTAGPREPWLPWPPEAARALARDPARRSRRRSSTSTAVSSRRAARSPALQVGDWIDRDAPDGVLAYERVAGADRRLVLVNFTREATGDPGRRSRRGGERRRGGGRRLPRRARPGHRRGARTRVDVLAREVQVVVARSAWRSPGRVPLLRQRDLVLLRQGPSRAAHQACAVRGDPADARRLSRGDPGAHGARHDPGRGHARGRDLAGLERHPRCARARFPDPPLYPATPVQRLAGLLFELYTDEFLMLPGLLLPLVLSGERRQGARRLRVVDRRSVGAAHPLRRRRQELHRR